MVEQIFENGPEQYLGRGLERAVDAESEKVGRRRVVEICFLCFLFVKSGDEKFVEEIGLIPGLVDHYQNVKHSEQCDNIVFSVVDRLTAVLLAVVI